MSEQAVQEATKALWDYINSLEPGQKAKAIAFQQALEEEAARTEGGMLKVIVSRTMHNAMLLQENLDEVQEIVAGEQAASIIKKAQA